MATHSLATEAKQATGWFIVLSVVMIVAGILAIGLPLAAGIAVNIVVAWLLILAGAAHFAFGWHLRGIGGVTWQFLLGILYVGVGVYLLLRPLAGLLTLTLALAIYLFIEGIIEIALSFGLRPRSGWGWMLLDGIVTLILGVMIWRLWPSATEWVIGTLIGINMIFSGLMRLMLSMTARSLVSKVA